MLKVGFEVHIFHASMPLLQHYVEIAFFSLSSFLRSFVENQLVFRHESIYGLRSVPLIYLCLCILLVHSFDYCRSIRSQLKLHS